MIVHEGAPMTAYDGRTIRLRAGYSPLYKKATLVHEFGHRLSFLLPRTADLDDHRLLYLFLYDVWTDLYGRAFADRMVSIERRIPGRYDYDAAWTWALAMTRAERQARLRASGDARGNLTTRTGSNAFRRGHLQQCPQLICQRGLVPAETVDHGREQRLRIERLQAKRMTCLTRDELGKRKLRAAIALTEGMNGI